MNFENCNIPKFTIIYATQTGTAEELSEKLSEECKKQNWVCYCSQRRVMKTRLLKQRP